MSRDRNHTVVVAGGVTGGHFYPGLAVVEELEAFDIGVEPVFVGTEEGIEARVAPELGYRLETMDVPPLKGRSLREWLSSGFQLTSCGLRAASLVRELKPDLTISVGGYAAGPFSLAAAVAGYPTVLLEQNREPGMANGLLARFVDRAFVTYEETCGMLETSACQHTGNPVRRSIREAAAEYTYEAPEEGEPLRLLVTGGSGGARSLNERLPGALTELGDLAELLRVRHQYGKGRRDEVEGRYDDFPGEVELVDFIDDMAEAFAWADLMVARGGGTTIAEVLEFGLPTIFVPSPHVTDDQQTKNARAITEAGAAIMLPDDAIGSPRATRLIAGLLENRVSLENMAQQTRRLRPGDAAETIARECLALMSA